MTTATGPGPAGGDPNAADAGPGRGTAGNGAGLLAGRRVVVVGGASGIGLATTRAAAAAGAAVAVLDLDGDGARAAAAQAGPGAYGYQLDITDEAAVAATLDRAAADLRGIDTVLHVAGIMRGQGLDVREVTADLWARVIAANLTGPFLVAKHATGHLEAAGGGVLVFVASKAGIVTGSGSVPYGASKGGLHGLALTLARQLRPRGIRVHTLCPGDIDTPLMRRSLDEAARNGADAAGVARVRAGLGRPEDVAAVLTLLAAPAADALDGTVYTS
ncbi:SDR family oxidoreductase [Polymorphospora sp. NPDC051019]